MPDNQGGLLMMYRQAMKEIASAWRQSANFRHHVLTVGLTLCALGISALLGKHLLAVGLVTVPLAHFLAQRLTYHGHEYWCRFLTSCHRLLCVLPYVALLGCCVYLFGTRIQPDEPAIRRVVSTVETVSTVVFLLWAMVVMVKALLRGRLGRPFRRFLCGLTLYALVLWVTGLQGDNAYRWIKDNPIEATGVTASLLVINAARTYSRSVMQILNCIANVPLQAKWAAAKLSSPFSRRDNDYITAHEAGHAMVYAALGHLPPRLVMAINDDSHEAGTLGFVGDFERMHKLDDKPFAEWQMLLCLAGKAGEAALLGSTSTGSTDDHSKWLDAARPYLCNHFMGIFYDKPQNALEQASNDAILERMQAQQMDLLKRFFSMNNEVQRQLAETLRVKRIMTRDELLPYLRRVSLPDDFPRPFGRFDEFSAHWVGSDHATAS